MTQRYPSSATRPENPSSLQPAPPWVSQLALVAMLLVPVMFFGRAAVVDFVADTELMRALVRASWTLAGGLGALTTGTIALVASRGHTSKGVRVPAAIGVVLGAGVLSIVLVAWLTV